MDTNQRALALIQSCEAGIRALIEEAVAAREYEQLTRLGSIAKAVSMIADDLISEGPARVEPVERVEVAFEGHRGVVAMNAEELPANGPAQLPKPKHREPPKREAAGYPQFVRDRDRLVKLGWSKKDRAVYEHRAPLLAVQAVFAGLLGATKKQGVFRPEDLIPTKLSDGTDVPSYQVYLVLAWLRSLDVVQRQGNDGYKVLRKQLPSVDMKKYWEMTQERSTT